MFEAKSRREMLYLVTFATSLTLFLGVALFISVGMNPRPDGEYGNLPWIYAGLCAVGSAVLYAVSGQLLKTLPKDTEPDSPTTPDQPPTN
jgi:hypothetical protein